MPTAFKVLKLLSVDLHAGKPIDREVLIPMFSDALKRYVFYLEEADIQPMTPSQFFNNVLLTGENNITHLLHDHWHNRVLQELYLITLEAAEEAEAQLNPHLNDKLLPLPLGEYRREIIDNANGKLSVLSLPLKVDYYVKVFQYSPDAAEKFESMAQRLKKNYHPQLGVDIDAIIKALSSFIKDNQRMKDREGISSFRFAMETLILIVDPYYIQQKNTNLCGVAALLVVLLRYSPHIYMNIASDLYLYGNSRTYFQINFPENIVHRDYFYEYVMIGIKRSSNYFGYDPDNILLEPFGGFTRPVSLVNYLEGLGFTNIHENIQIKNMNHQPIGVFHRFVVGGIYSSHHQDEQINDRFLRKLEQSVREGKAVILSVGPSEWTFKPERAELVSLLSWVNIRSEHYVTLIDLKKDEDGNIEICISDSGESHYIKHTLTEQEVLEVISGAIICDPPKPDPKLRLEKPTAL